MAQTLHWPRHQAVEASAFAISSCICMKTSGRRLGAAEALRQQRPVEPVLDQGGHHRRGQPPRPLDLVGLARDQRRQRARALDQVRNREACSLRFLAPFSGFLAGEGAMVIHLG